MNAHQVHRCRAWGSKLEELFPSLTFHWFIEAQTGTYLMRVMRRRGGYDYGGYTYPARGEGPTIFEDHVPPREYAAFPPDVLLAKLALIA